MTYPSALLCHTANLQTGSTAGTANEWVTPTTPVYTQIKCRFGQSKKTYPYTDSGDRNISSPVCIIPTDIVPKEGDQIVGLTAPFTDTYLIKAVNPAMLASTVSHYVLSIEAVE